MMIASILNLRRRAEFSTGRAAFVLSAIAALAFAPSAWGQGAPPVRALSRDASNQRDWTIHIQIRLRTLDEQQVTRDQISATPQIVLDSVEFLYPLIDGSAIHDAWTEKVRGSLSYESTTLTRDVKVLDGYQGPSSIALWSVRDTPVRAHQLSFQGAIEMTSYETRIDEAVARRAAWPRGAWSPELASCLQPQLFVESDAPEIAALVQEWTRGDPRRLAPYDLAKTLAAHCLEHYRVTRGIFQSAGRRTNPTGRFTTSANFIAGYDVQGARSAAVTREGSPYDLACLLTAAYRAAGLPARLVIGLDVAEARKRRELPILRAWVEFFLPHERPAPQGADLPPVTIDNGEWIPVDITRQKEFSSRPPPLNQRWQHFGHNEESDFLAPIAFHWLPPENASGSHAPGLWSWRPTPGPPDVDADIQLRPEETPKRGGEPPRRKTK